MSKQTNKSNFNAMNVAGTSTFSRADILKLRHWKSPLQSKEWFCQWIQTSKKIKLMMYILIIHDMLIPNPFSPKTVNNFNSSPPFGLYDITDYDKQGLAAYKSFDNYRFFNDGYVESLLTAQLNQEGVHVYIAKVRPL